MPKKRPPKPAVTIRLDEYDDGILAMLEIVLQTAGQPYSITLEHPTTLTSIAGHSRKQAS